MKYRVAEWATGNVGRYALRAIINHPELELVGVIVSNPEKNGVDAAKLCGLDRSTGILATTDVARVLALKPDCICYTAGAETRLFEAVADMARVLEAGINVVSCSVVMLVWPECPIAELVDPLRTACEKGRTSFLTSGIDPGFANDIMPLMFTALSEYWTIWNCWNASTPRARSRPRAVAPASVQAHVQRVIADDRITVEPLGVDWRWRVIQPVDVFLTPGVPSSMNSCASKWLRVSTFIPQACTIATLPP